MKRGGGKNPAKLERCVQQVKKRGGAVNAYAVCTKSVGKKKRRGNPAAEARAMFEQFHGRPSTETISISRRVHYHSNLTALGELVQIKIKPFAVRGVVRLEDFEGAILACNEKGTQLYIEGGNQSVDPEGFGLDIVHEFYDLGEAIEVTYFTTKDHLGNEGGTANYFHQFKRPGPCVQYDALNKRLNFVGGQYVILPEGIDD